jgi:hypothetical protein
MGEFSAHRVTIPAGERIVIATLVDLYVSPVGDDVLNSGVDPSSPFRTPVRAIEWLSDKYITDIGFVTINCAAGVYDLDESLVMNHAQGNRVAIVGAEPEILLVQYVSDYKTTGFTAAGFTEYYSAVQHGITMSCVRPDVNSVFATITSSNPISYEHTLAGGGVIIEDFDLVYDDDYNPAYFYAAYPFHPRNNIVKQCSILGSHLLNGVSFGKLNVQSSIRDDWFCIPAGSSLSWGRLYGNAQQGISYISGSCANPSDTNETQTNAWFIPANKSSGIALRGQYITNVPVGYYGTAATTGIPIGATSNFMSATFPTNFISGKTAGFTYEDIDSISLSGWFTGTGAAGTFLNDTVLFGKNYHEHTKNSGWEGIGASAAWKSVNTNRITVKIIPTVFRRFGNILSIRSSGLRKIKNIFFDGIAMPAHYNLLAAGAGSSVGYSNKCAVNSATSKLGENMINEPEDLGSGLCSNVGIKDFQVGFYADKGSDVILGKVVVSNCTFGILANNRSSVKTFGSVCTGMGSVGIGAFNSSMMIAERCFVAFVGQSLVSLRLKETSQDFADNSFVNGQTFGTPDGKVKGTVWDWDPREKQLTIAVRCGVLEGGDASAQN